MSIVGYINEKLSPPENLGIVLLLLMPVIFISSYVLSYYTNNSLILNIGVFICGILFIFPLRLLIAIFLLWKNPQKYKEYEMKQFMKRREEEKSKFFLIFLYILWLCPKELKENNQIEKENKEEKE